MDVVHIGKSDSPGYKRIYFDGPIGTTTNPVVLTGPKMKHDSPEPLQVADEIGNIFKETEREYQFMAHGQHFIDVPNEVNELKTSNGETLKLGKSE